MFKGIFTLCIATFFSFAHGQLHNHLKLQEFGGLKKILKDRYIRILTTKNSFDYYIYQGKAKGIQYEMAREFTKYLNEKFVKGKNQLKIQFEMVPVDNDQLMSMLLSGKGDLIAAGLTITPGRKKHLAFSIPYRFVDEVIVTRKSIGPTFFRKKFHVRKSSSYWEAITTYNANVEPSKAIHAEKVDEGLHTENILELISLGRFDYTIVDSYLAEMAVKTYDDLLILPQRVFGKNLPIAWATRPENSELINELNQFMPKIKKGALLGNIFSRKYFKDMNRIKSPSFNSKKSKLSRYDQLVKKYAQVYGLDWRLMAALCFQESRFNQNIVNEWGAIGLFQVKQMTANEPYISIKNIRGPDNYENNIHAGIKYFAWIKKRYFDSNPNMDENARLRMAMAAYNAGPGRLRKARKLAKKLGLDQNVWFRQTELAMLKMKKTEPVTYVSEINKRYVSYLLLGIR